MAKLHKAGTVIAFITVIAICLFLISLVVKTNKNLRSHAKWRNADVARQTILDQNQLTPGQCVGGMEPGSSAWTSPSTILADSEGKVYIDYNAPTSPERDASNCIQLFVTKDYHFEASAEDELKIRSIEKLDIPHQIGRLHLTFKSDSK